MKTKTKILFLTLGLICPYMGLVMYRVLAYPEHPFPTWFLYAAPSYLIGSVLVFVAVRKKIVANPAPLATPERNAQRLAAARSIRRLGYIWWFGPFIYFINGGLREPVWSTMFGLCWVCLLSWVCFREAKKIEAKVHQN
jgi:hypothetical protein